MKLKERPEDFQVEEVATPPPLDTHGPYQLFRLEKRGVEAFDALHAIARALGVERRDVSMAGLKDQRSESVQLVTALAPYPRKFEGRLSIERGLALVPLHRCTRAIKGEDIERNRFVLVVRDLAPAAVAEAQARLEAIRRDGLPDYFDDQRFGGASPERGFVAEAWSRGDFKTALELLISRPSPKDPRRERLEKEAVRARWGDWKGLAAVVTGDAAPLVRALARAPDDLAGAFKALDPRFRALLLAQYQSWLWNEEAAAIVREALPRSAIFDVMYRCGTFALPKASAGVTHAAAIEALRAREHPYPVVNVPPELGLDAKLGARPILLRVEKIELEGEAKDELRPDKDRRKVVMRLEIPRGAYATLVAKRLFYEPAPPAPRPAAPPAAPPPASNAGGPPSV